MISHVLRRYRKGVTKPLSGDKDLLIVEQGSVHVVRVRRGRRLENSRTDVFTMRRTIVVRVLQDGRENTIRSLPRGLGAETAQIRTISKGLGS